MEGRLEEEKGKEEEELDAFARFLDEDEDEGGDMSASTPSSYGGAAVM